MLNSVFADCCSLGMAIPSASIAKNTDQINERLPLFNKAKDFYIALSAAAFCVHAVAVIKPPLMFSRLIGADDSSTVCSTLFKAKQMPAYPSPALKNALVQRGLND